MIKPYVYLWYESGKLKNVAFVLEEVVQSFSKILRTKCSIFCLRVDCAGCYGRGRSKCSAGIINTGGLCGFVEVRMF